MTRPVSEPFASSPDAFLRTLLRSGLHSPAHLDSLLQAAPTNTLSDVRKLIDYLISLGELTHYQSEKLLKGRWQGLVLENYQVLAPLGRGGMGTVYLARTVLPTNQTPSDNPVTPQLAKPSHTLVALKVLPPKRAREEEKTLARFRREMELGKHLEHPNVTRTFDTGEVNGLHFIAMEFVPGESLRQVVVKGGPLTVADTARVFADVCAGLAHAHARGLIHRDLKPGNIMVTPEGRAKILDLGLAMLLGETLPSDPTIVGGEGYILGTMDYIAPEQTLNATDVGPWSDVYAVGCSMYYALTGVPPFPGGSAQQKLKWHRTEVAPAIRSLNPEVPFEIAGLIERMMSKSPADRPASAWAVRNMLLTWAADTVSRAKAAAASQSERAAVAEFDTRTKDPALWDSSPQPTIDDLPATDHDSSVSSPSLLITVYAIIAVVLGMIFLVVIFGLLRKI